MKFKMFARSTCVYCTAAIALLEQNKIPYEIHSMDGQVELLSETTKKYNWSTLPIVLDISNGTERLIGGYKELVSYLKEGKSLLKG